MVRNWLEIADCVFFLFVQPLLKLGNVGANPPVSIADVDEAELTRLVAEGARNVARLSQERNQDLKKMVEAAQIIHAQRPEGGGVAARPPWSANPWAVPDHLIFAVAATREAMAKKEEVVVEDAAGHKRNDSEKSALEQHSSKKRKVESAEDTELDQKQKAKESIAKLTHVINQKKSKLEKAKKTVPSPGSSKSVPAKRKKKGPVQLPSVASKVAGEQPKQHKRKGFLYGGNFDRIIGGLEAPSDASVTIVPVVPNDDHLYNEDENKGQKEEEDQDQDEEDDQEEDDEEEGEDE